MSIERKDVERVARLARLELAEEEFEQFTSQIDRVVEYFGKLQQLDVSDLEPMMHAAQGAELREDVRGETMPRDAALDGAPAKRDGMFRVPPVIE